MLNVREAQVLRAARRVVVKLARPLLVWLLAVMCPLQAGAAVAFATQGPLHSHRAIARSLVLIDFRRAMVVTPPLDSHILTGLGHFHAHAAGAAQRHRHALADGSVVRSAADRAGEALADDERGAASLGAFTTLISLSTNWQPPHAAHVLPTARCWQPSDGALRRIERPPSGGATR